MQMEGEVVVLKKVLALFLAVVVVCCVYGYGGNTRFSVQKWLENVTVLGSLGSIEDLTKYWTDKDFFLEYPEGQGPPEYILFESYEGDNEILEWFDGVVGFFKRLYYTVKEFANMLVNIFSNVRLLLPWNATVIVE